MIIQQKKKKSLTSDIEELEQYSRRNCLLLHRVQESKNENTDDTVLRTMSEELDIEINGNDLDRTHGIAVAETREMVSRELLLPNISAMPPELILIPI